ncbi:hypothetical protein BDV32DRAFT_145023 [Aspergillus pseudonomiae]|nr:hypothetical protein BDV32DRAFT_145023 [Aspergillus pseudonomiae]
MNGHQWGIVMRNNDLLNGKFFEGGDTDDKRAVLTNIRRARYTAFALKERTIPHYSITFEVRKPVPSQLTKPEVKFRIPRFQICDSSSVAVFETKSSIADSMASNGFSQTTVEAAAGGGAFGVSVGVKAGATTSESSSYAQSSASVESLLHVVYLFPRVELFFDVDDLELTEECQHYLEKVRNPAAKKEDADTFFQKFGHVFVPHMQLGGRLHSKESTSSIAGATTAEKASTLKAAASAYVSGYGFQASVSASHETASNSKTEKSRSSSNHSIKWHADGGDTLLCNNKIGMIDIVKLIGKMDGWHDIPRQFEEIYFGTVQFKVLKCESGFNVPSYLGMFKYGTFYPLRFCARDGQIQEKVYYTVRPTTGAEHYQNENVLYAGLDEEPNVLVRFCRLYQKNGQLPWLQDFKSFEVAQRIGTHDMVQMDFYDLQTKEYVGWLQNNGGIAKLRAYETKQVTDQSMLRFMYV